jgi:hypothetical protein
MGDDPGSLAGQRVVTELFLAAPFIESLVLYERFARKEPAAIAQVRGMFPPDAECFLCAGQAGDDFGLYVTEDPAGKRQRDAILAPLCATCMAIPLLHRLSKIQKVMLAMFPRLRRHDMRLMSPAERQALRRMAR